MPVRKANRTYNEAELRALAVSDPIKFEDLLPEEIAPEVRENVELRHELFRRRFYDTKAAAKYLGITTSGMRYHLYLSETIAPETKIGQYLAYTQEQMDQFEATRRPAGFQKKTPPGDSSSESPFGVAVYA